MPCRLWGALTDYAAFSWHPALRLHGSPKRRQTTRHEVAVSVGARHHLTTNTDGHPAKKTTRTRVSKPHTRHTY